MQRNWTERQPWAQDGPLADVCKARRARSWSALGSCDVRCDDLRRLGISTGFVRKRVSIPPMADRVVSVDCEDQDVQLEPGTHDGSLDVRRGPGVTDLADRVVGW
jgi:hypothetical protein